MLMLGDDAVRDVTAEGAIANLREFLAKRFFTDRHFRSFTPCFLTTP
jgi:hypothetical protein